MKQPYALNVNVPYFKTKLVDDSTWTNFDSILPELLFV